MSRKPDGTQRSGRFTAPPAAGAFGGSDTALSRLARPFVPQPFRSTGGMSTSADTMMSIGMGRHNTDEEMPDDQTNINAIVSRKVSDRRYLPRKIGNMKNLLHTVPISESLAMSSDDIHKNFMLYEFSFSDIGSGLSSLIPGMGRQDTKALGNSDSAGGFLDSAMQIGASFIPFAGDIYKGVRAYRTYGDIEEEVKDLLGRLASEVGLIDLYASPQNSVNRQRIERISLRSQTDKDEILVATTKIATLAVEFLIDALSSIPFEVIPNPIAAKVDSIIDATIASALQVAPSIDPTGEKTALNFYKVGTEMADSIRSLADSLPDLMVPDQLISMCNLISNLGIIHGVVSSSNKIIDQEPGADADVPLSERKNRKKRRADEMSTTGNVAGYVGKVSGPANPRQFYSTMAKVAGSEYLVDPLKSAKPKP